MDVKKRMRKVGRVAAWPAVSFFDPRFAKLQQRVEALTDNVAEQQKKLATLGQLEQRLLTDAEATYELATLNGKMAQWLKDHMDSLSSGAPDASLVDGQLRELTEGAARFANYVGSHKGFAAQADLWFNPPCWIEHRLGEVVLGGVNERIVEMPYVMSSLGSVPAGGHVLDFGAAESTLAFSLASLGYQTTALDLRPYPLEHPLLTAVVAPVESWEGPSRPYDAIVCLSTLEHVGLGWYGDHPKGHDLDRVILERLKGWLAPGGVLAFTAPFGHWSVDTFERRYDRAHLEKLFEGWEITDRHFAIQRSRTMWESEDGAWERECSEGENLVILLQARPAR